MSATQTDRHTDTQLEPASQQMQKQLQTEHEQISQHGDFNTNISNFFTIVL